MDEIPLTHPRYCSLKIREKISQGLRKGITHNTGLIAHGRGEAFDYLIGEKTLSYADNAERVAAAALITAKNPVISVNGNVAALVPEECIRLVEVIPAKLEVNLFHRTNSRIDNIVKELEKHGAKEVLGKNANANIPNLNHCRGLCEKKGIFSSDVVLVPLEDGDRCNALRLMGKIVIAIDLNPLSRTAKTANITIVDNVIRAIPNIEKWVKKLKCIDKKELKEMVNSWDNLIMLKMVLSVISKRLNSMF